MITDYGLVPYPAAEIHLYTMTCTIPNLVQKNILRQLRNPILDPLWSGRLKQQTRNTGVQERWIKQLSTLSRQQPGNSGHQIGKHSRKKCVFGLFFLVGGCHQNWATHRKHSHLVDNSQTNGVGLFGWTVSQQLDAILIYVTNYILRWPWKNSKHDINALIASCTIVHAHLLTSFVYHQSRNWPCNWKYILSNQQWPTVVLIFLSCLFLIMFIKSWI